MDTTEKVYHEVKEMVKQDAALYIYMRDQDGTVCIESMCVAFTTSDEKNIERLKEKAKVDGFMFWSESEEGRRWRKENQKAIGAALWNTMRHTFNGGWGR